MYGAGEATNKKFDRNLRIRNRDNCDSDGRLTNFDFISSRTAIGNDIRFHNLCPLVRHHCNQDDIIKIEKVQFRLINADHHQK